VLFAPEAAVGQAGLPFGQDVCNFTSDLSFIVGSQRLQLFNAGYPAPLNKHRAQFKR
jgi:hypothetical protein